MLKRLLMLCALLLSAPAMPDDHALDDLVINQTLTRFGQDFYREFVKHWRGYQLVMPASLTVHERPSARWGSQIWIEYRGRRIFQQNVGPSTRAIDSVAQLAASRAFNVMLQEQNGIQGGNDDFDQGVLN